ncbi:MAG: ATP-binding protein, partial [Burkholderiaceae bacterium]
DPTRLKQILLNLSSNAIKFTEQGSVQLALRCEGEQLKIAVIDSGIGISDQQIGKLFSPFIQADNTTTRRFGGSGLGLYISRRLAQMLGGDIAVTSTLGAGSRFEVSVATGPLDGVKCITALDQFDQTPPIGNEVFKIPALQGHILLAEDGPDNQRLVSALIAKTGATVTIVDDGKKAVEHAMVGDYAMILMDMQMPAMGGLEAIRMLRQVGFMRPIIAFTANVMKEEIDEYHVAGCNGYLSKPIDRSKFYQTLSEYLLQASETAQTHGAEAFFESAEFKELVMQFVAGLPEHAEQMKKAAAIHDLETVRGIAHTLKGAAASFGYPDMTDSAARLERAIKMGQAELIENGLVELNEMISAISQRHESA